MPQTDHSMPAVPTAPALELPPTVVVLGNRFYRITDIDGVEAELYHGRGPDGKSRWWLNTPGEINKAVYPAAFSEKLFSDSDGIRYVLSYATLVYRPLDPTTLAAVAQIIDPDHVYRVATDEQRALAELNERLLTLEDLEWRKTDIEQRHTHPARLKHYRDLSAQFDATCADICGGFGFDPSQLALARRLFTSRQLHIRDLLAMVNAAGE